MKDKLSKIYSVLKKYGIKDTLKKIIKYIDSRYGTRFNIKKRFYFWKYKKDWTKKIVDVLEKGNYERIILWRGNFGWNVPLFQRPQHIALQFSRQNCLVFYEVTSFTDNVEIMEKQNENLYLVNLGNPTWKKIFEAKLKLISEKPHYLHFYSTDWNIDLKEVEKFIKSGYLVLYEYIDELSPKLSGTKELPINIKQKYEYMLQNPKQVITVVTADEIKKDVENKRGNENLIFACNGVDYKHFSQEQKKEVWSKEFCEIVNQGKAIIGYYGALASWVDYELLKQLAKKHESYNIVLFGTKYDDSFDKSGINEYKNIYFGGSINYFELPHYAKEFDVCIIPFLLNDITRSTSPLKLFEYMAMEKPIVTTAMRECMKYKSVLIAENTQEFINKVEYALELDKKKDLNYFLQLRKEAEENTWEKKAKIIISALKNIEDKEKREKLWKNI